MINFTFQKEISDIPMILPVEMFIIEEQTAAPEFVDEINEIVPTMQEEVVEETKEITEDTVTPQPIIEETIPELAPAEVQENLPQIKEPNNITETEEILTDNSSNQATEFVIEEIPGEQIKEPEEETPLPLENTFEIELKQKHEPKEIEKTFDNLNIIVKKNHTKTTLK